MAAPESQTTMRLVLGLMPMPRGIRSPRTGQTGRYSSVACIQGAVQGAVVRLPCGHRETGDIVIAWRLLTAYWAGSRR